MGHKSKSDSRLDSQNQLPPIAKARPGNAYLNKRMATATISVFELEVYGYVGVSEEERKIGHRLSIDLEMDANITANETDSLAGTIDYGAVAAAASQVVKAAHCHTLERLAQHIADALFDQFVALTELTITIRKPLPPFPEMAASVAVSLTFSNPQL